jgi:hypothetical protein
VISVSLHDWLKNGWLTEHITSSEEIKDLFDAVDRDLTDCQLPGLSPDWRLHIAYNAALLIAAAALAAVGYRPTRESHHYRLIQSLAYTIKADAILIKRFDVFRKKRNISGYERTGVISDHEVMEMIDLASQLRSDVTKWLQANHPALMRK